MYKVYRAEPNSATNHPTKTVVNINMSFEKPSMNPSSKSLTSGSRKGSRLTGRESGNRYDGTNPTV